MASFTGDLSRLLVAGQVLALDGKRIMIAIKELIIVNELFTSDFSVVISDFSWRKRLIVKVS